MQHFGVCKKRASGIAMPLPVLLNNKYRQAVRIMKITAFTLLIFSLHVSAGGFSQAVISLSEKDAQLTKVLNAIEKQTDYTFFYDADWIKQAKNITIEVKKMQIQQVLDLLFKNQPLSYNIDGKIITITRKKNDTPNREDKTATPPPLNIHGKVIDENGKPVPGVTVMVIGTKKITVTDENGEFTFNGVDGNAVLAFSSVNMEAFEIAVVGKTEILAKLKTKTSQLDAIQIIAYGQTTKRLQTGNIGNLKGSEIEKQPVNNLLLALEGRIPGVFITQNTAVAGGSISIQIQGQNSLASGNDPFYVVDGVPYTSQLLSTTFNTSVLGTAGSVNTGVSAGNPLAFINPSDIESIEILKDADAIAIYGSRAANGAILITTKKGKEGNPEVSANFEIGWGKVTRKLDLLNTQQYIAMRKEALSNDGLTPDPFIDYDLTFWDTTRYTDWQKVLIGGTAKHTNAQAAITGGNAGLQYLLGVGYHNETTVFPNNFGNKKGSLHFNVNNTSPNRNFSFEFTANYLIDDNRLPFNMDLTAQAVKLAPNAPSLYNSDGTLNWAIADYGNSTWSNPLAYTLNRYSNNTINLISNLNLRYKILPSLEFRASFGYTSLHSKEVGTAPLEARAPEMRPFINRAATYGDNNINSWISEPQISYKRLFGKSKFEVLAGCTIQQNHLQGQSITGLGYNSDAQLDDIKSAATLRANFSVQSVYKYSALFGRINYNLSDKYIFNLSARRDGSSRFGTGNQFHNFGAVGAAWIFSAEEFVKKHLQILSFGKIRMSYGVTGNDQIGDYKFLNLYTPLSGISVPYQGITSLSVTGLPNRNLQWEQTEKLNFGIDLGFMSDRILFTSNIAINKSSNQLLIYALPINTGFQNILKNLDATIENRSLEFSLSAVVIKSNNFTWNTSINLTVPKNVLKRFPNIAQTGYKDVLVIGQSINLVKAYRFASVDPATGFYQFSDSSGKLTSYPNYFTDRAQLITLDPKLYGGLLNSITFKRFQLDFFFQFVKQNGLNYLFGDFLPGLGFLNQPATVLSRWQNPGDQTIIQRYNSDYSATGPYFNAISSNAAYGDASYIRLKNVSFSWQMPEGLLQKAKLKNGTIYLHAQNLFTKTNYIGLDPETRSSAILPPLRIITIGLKLTL